MDDSDKSCTMSRQQASIFEDAHSVFWAYIILLLRNLRRSPEISAKMKLSPLLTEKMKKKIQIFLVYKYLNMANIMFT